MTKTKPKDIAASVRARLLRLARERGEDFQLVLTRYANERLLFRLAASTHASRFVLKGATLFALWTGAPHRATRDVDLLGLGNQSEAYLQEVFSEVLKLDVDDDGIVFDLDSLAVGPIREDQTYGGLRVEVIARLTAAQVRLQVDVGFGDAITPEAAIVELPSLLDLPTAKMRAYPRETVVAEKVEAMVQLGMANSRMKDFYDLIVLSRQFEFESELLVRAIIATFKRRKTPLPAGLPVALTRAFADDKMKQAQWAGFVRKSGIAEAGTLLEAVEVITAFAAQPLAAAHDHATFLARWLPGGPWR